MKIYHIYRGEKGISLTTIVEGHDFRGFGQRIATPDETLFGKPIGEIEDGSYDETGKQIIAKIPTNNWSEM